MRVLVVHPPVLPYGYTLHHRFQRVWEAADYLRRRVPETRILDAGLLNMLQGQVLSEFATGYEAVAVYCEPQMLRTTADLVERLRYMCPATRVLLYGPAVTCFPAQVRGLDVDALGCRGDIEGQLWQFVQFASGHEGRSSNIAVWHRGGWREPTGTPETVPPAEWAFPPLAEMPMTDIARVYAMKEQPLTVSVTASRGCPYLCSFCATPELEGRADRRRPAGPLVDFISQHSRYRHWQFYSPTFTLNRRWCMDFLMRLTERNLGVRWRCTTRVDRLDPELVELMASSGCHMVGVGVETLGPTLDRVMKGVSQDQMRRAIRLLLDNGIGVKAYVILGLPGQTIDEVRETVRFVADLGATIRPTLYSPQGAADELDARLMVGIEEISMLDRKSFLADRDHYGEFLRLAFDRRVASPSM